MKSILIISILVCYSYESNSQNSPRAQEIEQKYNELTKELDHLDPLRSIFDLSDASLEYKYRLTYIVANSQNGQLICRLLVTPSFSPEYIIKIEKNTEKYFVTYLLANKNIWQTEKFDEIKFQKRRWEISKQNAGKIHNLFETSLDHTKSSDKTRKMTDGINYYFTSIGNGRLRSGTKKSPKKGTKIYELIQIIESLVQTDVDYNYLNTSIDSLIKRFNNEN